MVVGFQEKMTDLQGPVTPFRIASQYALFSAFGIPALRLHYQFARNHQVTNIWKHKSC